MSFLGAFEYDYQKRDQAQNRRQPEDPGESCQPDDPLAMPGDLNRIEVKGVLWRAFTHYGRLKVLYPRPAVEIGADPARAAARFPFLIVSKDQAFPGLERLADDPLAWIREAGESADLYRLNLQLVKRDGEWRVNLARLERFGGTGFQE
jgi:hypothetical protein